MDLLKLILSGRFAELNPEAVVVYMIMRADIALNETTTAKLFKEKGKLVSGLDVHSCALKSGLPELTVKRVIEDLRRKRWIKPCEDATYQLGEIKDMEAVWYVEVKEEHPLKESSVVSQLKDMLFEAKKRKAENKRTVSALTDEAKRGIAAKALGSLFREEKASTKLIKLVMELYLKKYGKKYPAALEGEDYRKEMSKNYGMINHLLRYCAESTEKAEEFIKFTFNNWSIISKKLDWAGNVSFSVFGSAKIFKSIQRWMREGFKDIGTYGMTPKDRSIRGDGLGKRGTVESFKEDKDVGF